MTTVMAVYNSEGCVGRCDDKCHSAQEPACDCICGGANHGKGTEQAIENTRQWAEEMIEGYALERGLGEYRAEKMGHPIQQLTLPV